MQTVTNPQTRLLTEGKSFVTKEMKANAGELLPKHFASVESVLIIKEGVCIVHMEDKNQLLNPGDAFTIPENEVHQIEAIQDFKAFHIMPKNIKFKFFK